MPLLRYKYLVSEYDATLLGEYASTGPYLTMGPFAGPGFDSIHYGTAPAVVGSVISEAAQKVLGYRHKYIFLTEADAIVRVRADLVIRDSDRLASIPVSPLPLWCITATIVDTIKGLHIRQCERAGPIPYPCVSFLFSPYWEKEHSTDVRGVGIDDEGNAHVSCDNCFGDTTILQGREYVVFLRNVIHDYDGVFSYYSFWPFGHFSAEGGIFPILPNGNVSIPSDYFKYGREVPYERFLELIRKDIDTIISPM